MIVVSDTSVLVNFLRIDRMDLFGRHPLRFVVTDHVAAEITDHYAEQKARFQAALATGALEQYSITGADVLYLFSQLRETRRLGAGESAAIAYAAVNGFALAIEDRRAARQASALKPELTIFGTQDLMVSMIHAGLLDVPQADEILDTWAADHRFVLKITTFGELL